MLANIEVRLRRFLIKAVFYNFLISIFVATLLMLRSDTVSLREFSVIWATSAVYTFVCGTIVSAAFYFTELWCAESRLSVRILAMLGFCVVGGALGAFVGSALLVLFHLKGPPGIVPLSTPFWQKVAATWIYVPLFVLVTTFFCFAVFGFELLMRRLEKTAGALKEKELQAERLLKLSAEAELKALQARINPHFLFNTLNSIASLVSEDPKKAEEMIEKLSALFRYTLSVDRGDRVPLEQELYILGSYLEIERLRLGRRLRVSMEVADELHALKVPPLLLQPIVENSVKYAVAAREEGGTILVRGRRNGDRCILEVIDDGPGFDGQTKGAGYALDNVRQRLAARYGGEHAFSIERSEGKTTVQIEIPLSTQ